MQKITVKEAAKMYGKDPAWVRAGIIAGWLPIGYATRNGQRVTDLKELNGRKGRINYYISPKKLKEDIGDDIIRITERYGSKNCKNT